MATSDNGTNHDFGPNVFVSKHPVLSHKITILRSSSTTPSTFRSVLQEVTYHLGYEATSAMTTRPIEVSVSAGKEEASQHQDCTGQKLVEHTALIPILRSGLGMSDSMLQLLPKSAVHHIGMYRIPGHAPVQYFNRLPKKCTADIAFVLDPALGSASTMMAVVAQIKKWGVPQIHVVCVVASRSGLEKLMEDHPDIKVTVGVVDDGLTDQGVVLPGLGDVGDRLFCTPMVDDDEDLLHPSKRTRTESVSK